MILLEVLCFWEIFLSVFLISYPVVNLNSMDFFFLYQCKKCFVNIYKLKSF